MRFLLLAGVVGLVACGGSTGEDTSTGDAALDSAKADSAVLDTAASDTLVATDSATTDSAATDSATTDSATTDSATTDSGGKFCGGIAGFKCPADSFCAMSTGMCKVADAGGTCTPIPSTCTKEYVPVCGCDGKTYGNACQAQMASMSIASVGACSTVGKTCGGKIGVTCAATEWCDFPKDGVACGAADGTGTCTARPEICPGIYDPVCGCNGKTYGNACEAHAAGTDDQTAGTCGK